MTISNLKIGVVIPARNEEGNLVKVLKDLEKMGLHEILVIDGHSDDGTIEVAKRFNAKIVSQNGNGKGDAVRQAFNNGYLDVDAFVLMDADGSMSPSEIPNMVNALTKSNTDIVKASRFKQDGYTVDMSFLRRIGNQIFLTLVNTLFSSDYTDLCYGFGLFTKDAIAKIVPLLQSRDFDIETEIFIKAKKLRLNIFEVPSFERRREFGKSNLNAFRDGFRILKVILREALSKT